MHSAGTRGSDRRLYICTATKVDLPRPAPSRLRSRRDETGSIGACMRLTAREVDVHVGQRTRHLRETLGISQGTLGRQLGLTFSQVQKYEKGTNRIGAGRLYMIAGFLGVAPSHFFEGVDSPTGVVTALP